MQPCVLLHMQYTFLLNFSYLQLILLYNNNLHHTIHLPFEADQASRPRACTRHSFILKDTNTYHKHPTSYKPKLQLYGYLSIFLQTDHSNNKCNMLHSQYDKMAHLHNWYIETPASSYTS
jgi:hypothetical protein